MASSVSGIAFALLAIASVGGALGVLGSKNVLHAAFWLLEVSVSAAGLYLLLEADYVAMVQLLVYAGAVAVLVIFTVMLTLRRREDAVRSRDFSLAAAVMAGVLALTLAVAVLGWHPGVVEMPADSLSILEIGRRIFSVDGWAFPFEIASLVLTAALVGAVWWTREGDE